MQYHLFTIISFERSMIIRKHLCFRNKIIPIVEPAIIENIIFTIKVKSDNKYPTELVVKIIITNRRISGSISFSCSLIV